MEFDATANNFFFLPEWPNATFCKGENQPNDVDDNNSENDNEKWFKGYEAVKDVYIKESRVII